MFSAAKMASLIYVTIAFVCVAVIPGLVFYTLTVYIIPSLALGNYLFNLSPFTAAAVVMLITGLTIHGIRDFLIYRRYKAKIREKVIKLHKAGYDKWAISRSIPRLHHDAVAMIVHKHKMKEWRKEWRSNRRS